MRSSRWVTRLAAVFALSALSNIASAETGNGISFSPGDQEISSGVLDTAKNRLIVGIGRFGEPGALIAVDLKTGNRSLFSGSLKSAHGDAKSAGAGPDFQDVRSVASGAGSLWVLGVTSTTNLLTQVDPKTGNRVKQLKMDGDPLCKFVQTRPNSMVFAGDKLYSIFVSAVKNGLMAIDTTGSKPVCTEVSSETKGSGPSWTGNLAPLTYGASAFWVVDFTNSALFKIDPTNGARTIVARVNGDKKIGSGPEVLANSGATFANGSVWLMGNLMGSRGDAGVPIISINPTSYERKTYKWGDGPMVREEGSVWVLPSGVVVLGQASRVLNYEPKTTNVTVLSEP